ncbi:hypothetical protein ACU686_35470 [Yinghuangia aomiensis]
MFAEGAREAWVAHMEILREDMHAEHEKSESAARRWVARNILANPATDHRDMSPVYASTISDLAAEAREARSELDPEPTAYGALDATPSTTYADVVWDTLYQHEYSANAGGTGLISKGSLELIKHAEVRKWVQDSLAATVTLAKESARGNASLHKVAELFLAGSSIHAGEKLAKFEGQRDPGLTDRVETLAETELSRNSVGREFLDVISEHMVRIVSVRAPSALEKEIERTPGTRPLTKNTKAAAHQERQRQTAERERNERDFPASRLEPRMPRLSDRVTQPHDPPSEGLGPSNSPETPSRRATPPDRTVAGPDSDSRSAAAAGFTKLERSQLLSRSDGWAPETQVNDKQVRPTVVRDAVRELRK